MAPPLGALPSCPEASVGNHPTATGSAGRRLSSYAAREAGRRSGSAPSSVEEIVVKKLVVLAVAAAVGFLVWKKVQDDRAEQDLWTEATNEYADLR
jgi:hypothetical protein